MIKSRSIKKMLIKAPNNGKGYHIVTEEIKYDSSQFDPVKRAATNEILRHIELPQIIRD